MTLPILPVQHLGLLTRDLEIAIEGGPRWKALLPEPSPPPQSLHRTPDALVHLCASGG
jgi:hypothetical protein